MTKIAIGVTLSGNPKVYHYAADKSDLLNCTPGVDRVVVPNKTKENGTLSLSIGVFQCVAPEVSLDGLKPIVQFLDSNKLRMAQIEVLRLETEKPSADA
jgi:hypothetical protein